MTERGKHFVALAVSAALLMLAGCGSSDKGKDAGKPLPRDAAAAIAQRLDEVQRRFDAGKSGNRGACNDIENDSYKAIDATVNGLPADVDPDVRKALEDSLARLQDLTGEGCSGVVETPPKQDTTPHQETAPPQTVPQETVPPEQTNTTETVPKEKKPKKEKPSNGNGNGTGGQPGDTPTPGNNGGGQTVPQGGGE